MIDIDTAEGASFFVFGVLLNQGMPAHRVWRIPEQLAERLGGSELDRFTVAADVRAAMRTPPALHRFPASMAGHLTEAAELIQDRWAGDARRIWAPGCDADGVLDALRALPGIGEHKALVGLAVLTHDYGVPVLRGSAPLHRYAHGCPGLSPAFPLLQEVP